MVFHKSGPKSFILESFAFGAEAVLVGASTTARQVLNSVHNRLANEQQRCTTHEKACGILSLCLPFEQRLNDWLRCCRHCECCKGDLLPTKAPDTCDMGTRWN